MAGRSLSSRKDEPAMYHIRIQGKFDSSWSDWFDHMSLRVNYDRGTSVTTLSGIVSDQAALYGLLNRIRDLGLTLLFVEREIL